MGAFKLKVSKAKGVVAMGGLFSLKYRATDFHTGEVIEHEKSATHGMPYIQGKSVYVMIREYIKTGKAEYEMELHSSRYIQSLLINQVPGSMVSHDTILRGRPNPNMETEDGERVWKVYQPTSNPLNQETISKDTSLSILQDATMYLAKSVLNST